MPCLGQYFRQELAGKGQSGCNSMKSHNLATKLRPDLVLTQPPMPPTNDGSTMICADAPQQISLLQLAALPPPSYLVCHLCLMGMWSICDKACLLKQSGRRLAWTK